MASGAHFGKIGAVSEFLVGHHREKIGTLVDRPRRSRVARAGARRRLGGIARIDKQTAYRLGLRRQEYTTLSLPGSLLAQTVSRVVACNISVL
jgi:hypothetical protein